MSRKIIGVTVGTPTSPAKIAHDIKPDIKAYIDEQSAQFSNALKGRKMGSVVHIDDFSPVPHKVSVKLSSNTIKDFSYRRVLTYGKNLFNKGLYSADTLIPDYDLLKCTVEEFTENGWVLKGANSTGKVGQANGAFTAGKGNRGFYLREGDVVTISANYTVLEDPYEEYRNSEDKDYKLRIDLSGGHRGSPIPVPKPNVETRVSQKLTVAVSGYYYPIMYLNSAKIKIEKIQVEVDKSATGYEDYVGSVYTPKADGIVENVNLTYPNTTIAVDSESVVIECEYNRDMNKAFAELQQAILSLGG